MNNSPEPASNEHFLGIMFFDFHGNQLHGHEDGPCFADEKVMFAAPRRSPRAHRGPAGSSELTL